MMMMMMMMDDDDDDDDDDDNDEHDCNANHGEHCVDDGGGVILLFRWCKYKELMLKLKFTMRRTTSCMMHCYKHELFNTHDANH